MNKLSLFACASAAVALGLPTFAQSVDSVTNPSAPGVQPAVGVSVAPQTPPGSSKAVLVPYENFITIPGGGAGGGDLSELYTTQDYNILGFGNQNNLGNICADDFVVPAGETWNVSSVKWLFYQTNAATTGTITGMFLNLWGPGNDPTGQLVGGEDVTGGNQIQSQVWSGVYRAADTAPTSTARALIEVTGAGAWLPPLAAGSYFMECSATGSLTSGPWSPPRTEIGQVMGTNPPYYSVQAIGGGAFAQLIDTGISGTQNEPMDMVFQIEGSNGGGSTVYCTSRPTSIAGCVPTLSATTLSITKGAGGTIPATAGPVPGGNSPGILIFGKTLAGAPIIINFGELCLQGFNRAPTTIAGPGGTSGTCSGSYTFNLQLAIDNATASQAAPGDTVYFQAWYRDTPNPFGANLTNAMGDFSIL